MPYIEPHAHMVSRTTDDYQAMAIAGCEAICEPAFWAGFDRSSAQGFHDYYRQLTEYEPQRAANSASNISAGYALTQKKLKTQDSPARLWPSFLNFSMPLLSLALVK